MNKIVVYTDGGAVNNPGPAAIGIIIKEIKRLRDKEIKIKEKKYSEYIGETTNNQAEYQALIFALKKAKSLFGKKKIKDSEVECYSDSQLLVNQLRGKYKILEKGLQPLFIEIWNLKQNFKSVSFNFVPREKNKEADKLVKSELSRLS